jgi:hypothetical protein
MLSDPKDENKWTHMLIRSMEEEDTIEDVSSPLPKWDV